jgi:enamine deaminase RidA (YjgF/YER057c/UK114 family)
MAFLPLELLGPFYGHETAEAESTMATIDERLVAALKPGEVVPDVAPPGGHYLPFSVCGSICHLAGYISHSSATDLIIGQVRDGTVGAAAARTCALGHLALLRERCGGLDNVACWHKVNVYVNAESDYPDSPMVANGYTDMIVDVFGKEIGMHARTAISVAGLPMGASVEVEAVVELKNPSLAKRMT